MSDTTSGEPRAAKVAYYEAGLHLLATRGYGALKLSQLCAQLGVTTGAFYHNFRNWKDYTDRLLQYWYDEQTARLIHLVLAESESIRRLQILLEVSSDLPHSAEAAIRVWSTIDPDVAEIQKAVDHERLDVVIKTYESIVGDHSTAVDMAHTSMYLLIGFEVAEPIRDLEVLRRALQSMIDLASQLSDEPAGA